MVLINRSKQALPVKKRPTLVSDPIPVRRKLLGPQVT